MSRLVAVVGRSLVVVGTPAAAVGRPPAAVDKLVAVVGTLAVVDKQPAAVVCKADIQYCNPDIHMADHSGTHRPPFVMTLEGIPAVAPLAAPDILVETWFHSVFDKLQHWDLVCNQSAFGYSL